MKNGHLSGKECGYCQKDAHAACERCERDLCELCTRCCDECAVTWCRFCTVVDYDNPFERTLCFGCYDDRTETCVQVGKNRGIGIDSDGDDGMAASQ